MHQKQVSPISIDGDCVGCIVVLGILFDMPPPRAWHPPQAQASGPGIPGSGAFYFVLPFTKIKAAEDLTPNRP
ncbi:MAG: hypothetical protein A3A96_01220 [Candidatus Zambryskibacteria bacterium RIFCSPLOWO2_01_FULL_39_39]|uniref:Uncharacterized protein n=1 Tax=Candidatus Zambryskibacteria bacterium RIFCSPLOWO2_01_FULL_39_39 TaxID=1802758 RepID=A0A1G2TXV9_9BACT|nr:MAG: hypothetical protein UT00_C0006G0074 [Parcubacteria group bacterium GW2011_GWA1_38_7]OHA87127.1 MAG: hypothetical protein A2644_03675 [Candidatus Zambryskibacteria bacterium RIFCSPHIGHO2_01_FULL_39_63]OHA94668.1 MAG: hypothetical protein A3B88_00480 [Candidatus Zambryskibacteria bacterium RIFCSPHIGHO2_02_FULL_39_19]OHA98119.1 MAG: hypothetical protein A3F20_01380 [Candidatus Zambryskibacteria bacterium RIFCSPHIGHO2_12_FULL_39_21]OHB02131.1 MAG: hypothetical protein A3A96_01220 [Candidat